MTNIYNPHTLVKVAETTFTTQDVSYYCFHTNHEQWEKLRIGGKYGNVGLENITNQSYETESWFQLLVAAAEGEL